MQTYVMHQVGFKTMISVFEQQKTVHALYRMATAVRSASPLHFVFTCLVFMLWFILTMQYNTCMDLI